MNEERDDMALDYKSRQAVMVDTAPKYRGASKGKKRELLTQLVEQTGLNRRYLAGRLRAFGRRILLRIDGQPVTVVANPAPPRRKRRSRYQPIMPLLPDLWFIANYIAPRRFHSFLQSFLTRIVQRGEMAITKKQVKLLLTISPATLERRLRPARRQLTIRGLSHTRPSKLKSLVPIATHRDRCRTEPGHLEIDLVGHEGGDSRGDPCFTLTCTDPFLGWTRLYPLLNKARKWTVLGMEAILADYPFPVRHIYSDSGAEFINEHFIDFCRGRSIAFQRSRPNHKNDNCYVEQRNYSVVRTLVGYGRYEGEEAQIQLKRLYDLANPFQCFFQPSARLTEVIRIGSKRTRKHDVPAAPYERMLKHGGLPEEGAKKLAAEFDAASPVRLRTQMATEQKRLLDMAKKNDIKKAG